MADKLLIKKYPNRRLYDTEKSRYIGLGQLKELVKGGREVEVVDVQSSEDVTAFTLTQILLEEARAKNVLLPLPLLYLVIQYGDSVLGEFFEKYLHETVKTYLAWKADFDEQFRRWLALSADFSEQAQRSMQHLSPFKPLQDFLSSAAQDLSRKRGPE